MLCRRAAGRPSSGRRRLALGGYRRLVGTAEASLEPGQVNASVMPVGQVLPADREQPQPLRFAETSPDPVRLTNGQGVRRALRPNRAGVAHRLGLGLPAVEAGAALAVRVEELGAVASTAQTESLPVPQIGDGTGQSCNIRHQHLLPRDAAECGGVGRTTVYPGGNRLTPGSSMSSPGV